MDRHALVSGCPDHWIIQLKSAVTCATWSQCTLVPDGRTSWQ